MGRLLTAQLLRTTRIFGCAFPRSAANETTDAAVRNNPKRATDIASNKTGKID